MAEAAATNKDPGQGISSMLSAGDEVEIFECDKTGHIQERWLHTSDGRIIPVLSQNRSDNILAQSFQDALQAMFDSFLPVGFPHSVSEDYLAYQVYDSLQAFFSTITSLLASRALLEGLGVGDANSSATFATLLTIFKDAMSRVATIVFAHRFGLRIEPDAKRYRFLADLFNDTAFFLELYSPYLSQGYRFLAVGTAEALRALCGVAAGASKAALSVHFAKHDNLAELNAKEASQETAVGLVGLLVGTIVVKYVQERFTVLCLMSVLVLGHLWVNYLGVRSVHMTALNRQRATILFQEYLKSGKVLSPREVAYRESILFWRATVSNRDGHQVARIEFAESYQHARTPPSGSDGNCFVLDGQKHTKFITRLAKSGLSTIRIIMWDRAGPAHVIMAWFLAVEIAWVMVPGEGYSDKFHEALKKDVKDEGESLAPRKYRNAALWENMQAVGWDLDSQAFETGPPVRIRMQPAARKDE
ncbi:Vitamin B6 photo-protection and homoeostasis [Geosmithia morbida]|uniref:Vitamin B6 photo-protection and homoeostasis n=1 Tax=Geosmithia morbida TaxID=1094350 RepID=A0A9P4YUG7_9HYPO|nr:Vitamin B6 photo-protection and homoeostasis [Geosmithia morbida]KAF4122004.1 Vitamin B6 photo-protection and homoeostasis [Geosmithia morbida]